MTTLATPEKAGPDGPELARTAPLSRNLIRLLVAASAVAAAFAKGRPVGIHPVDVFLLMCVGAVVAAAGSRARRAALVLSAGAAVAASSGPALAMAATALVLSVLASWLVRRHRVLATAIGLLVGNALLRLSVRGPEAIRFHGGTALIAAAIAAPILFSGYRHAHSSTRKITRRVGAGLLLFTFVALVLFGGSLFAARTHVSDGLASSRDALSSARNGHQDQAKAQLASASSSLSRAHLLLSGWWVAPARLIPVLGYQVDAFDKVSSQALALSRSAQATLETGDYHDLKYQSGAFNIDLMKELQSPLRDSVAQLRSARASLRGLGHGWLVSPIQDKIGEFGHDIDDALPDATLASQAVNVSPGLLGGNGTRHYLVLFTTPAEERALGGFIGAFGELTADGGRVRLTRSGPIADLLEAAPPGARHITPVDQRTTEYLRRYQGTTPQDYLQDLTLSPDFPSVAEVAAQLYPQSGGTKVDGVILLDPYGLAALMQLTGPVRVPELPTPLTSSNAAQVLLVEQYTLFPHLSTRQDLLQSALKATFEKLTSGDLPGPKEFSQKLGPAVHQGRLMLWSPNQDEEALFTRVHADGSFPVPHGQDFLSVRAQNSGHNKIDVFLHKKISSITGIDPETGLVDTTVSVTVTNTAPDNGLPDYVIGNTDGLPVGSNRLTVEVYSPLKYVTGTLDGGPLSIGPEEELGWHVYSTRIVLPAGATRTITMTLHGGLSLRHGYRLDIAPQPTVNADEYHAVIYTKGHWALSDLSGFNQDGNGASVSGPMTQPATYTAGLRRRS